MIFFDLFTDRWFIPHIVGPTRIAKQQKPSFYDNIYISI